MPYKNQTDKLLIPLALKRNIKLTDKDKSDIRTIYATGMSSHRKLAELYNVEKSTIASVLNPDKYELNKQRAKENKHKYYNKEKQAEYMRNHRKYRQELYLENKLENQL